MNRNDVKLALLSNGYEVATIDNILSFSLDPITYDRFQALKYTYRRGELAQIFCEYVDCIDFSTKKREKLNISEITKKEYKHEDYKQSSFLVNKRIKSKVKKLCYLNKVTISAFVRAFIQIKYMEYLNE